MKKGDTNFIRISGTVTSPVKISKGGQRDEAAFELVNKDIQPTRVKHNTFSVKWYGKAEGLALEQGDRVMVLGKAVTRIDEQKNQQVFIVTKQIFFY